jgi:hypothetical protein
MGLETIDHRAWSPRGVHTTLVNEVYARASLELEITKDPEEALEELIEMVKTGIEQVIGEPETSKVKVQRWYPGVVEEICEQVDEKRKSNVTQRLLKEATTMLERKQELQTAATKYKSIKELMGDGAIAEEQPVGDKVEAPDNADVPKPQAKEKPRRRVRQKMRSTPVVGGGLFGEHIEAKSGREERGSKIGHFTTNQKKDGRDLNWSFIGHQRGVSAEITVKGESYNIRISGDTWKDLQKGFGGQMVDSRGIEMTGINIAASNEDAPVVQRLQGFVRNMPLQEIKEETIDDGSEVASVDTSSHNLSHNL